MAGWRLSFAI